MIQVFVDMDGVLADFDAHYEAVFGVRPDKRKDDVDWGLVRAMTGFYADHSANGRYDRALELSQIAHSKSHRAYRCPFVRPRRD
ncbi:MAG: hypothetical protein FWD08_06305 [Alphaproteobacteria bacterium]|nr:hypothetical protein [Alphaproteobacteria bacterium]